MFMLNYAGCNHGVKSGLSYETPPREVIHGLAGISPMVTLLVCSFLCNCFGNHL